ncbi:MAG: helix-turn-helix domain-containing protein [Gammaproteobacteria bacterium]|nr:helix-turn-helix domain-containing protein [Gammaproteobacteria bacterium]
MQSSANETNSLHGVREVFSDEALLALCQRIIGSGILGRSKHYSALLEYLVQCSLSGKSPKEIELAVEVLDRGDDFDVSADSTVRVYVHQLRKKLDSYYERYELDSPFRIVIPKGQYTIAAQQKSAPAVTNLVSEDRKPFIRLNTGLLMLAIVLLLVNLTYMAGSNQSNQVQASQVAADHPVWNSVLEDEQPILLVMGDYYIFGELNANGNIARMVREFNVNSRVDLEEMQFTDFERAENYLDLDLSYMPEGSAFALARIVPILQESGKTVNITMMSDLTMADIRDNHIVYIGYISALEKLTDMTFAGSGLQVGRSYDELLNTTTEEYYTSDAGLPEEGEPFKDYGMFSTFPASTETQVVLISGMRDAGLMHTAQALSDADSLDDLVVAIDNDTDEALASFEALFEVFGIDRINFDANLVYAELLDTNQIWTAPQPP